MKKSSSKNQDSDLLEEYNFSQGVRGKYAQRFAKGSNVVVLPLDLAKAFPNAESVHKALRGLLTPAQETAMAATGKEVVVRKRKK